MLCKARHYVDKENLRNLYHTLFSSHIMYGVQIWGQVANIHTQKVFTIQDKAIRIIHFADFNATTEPLYLSSGILKLEDSVKLLNILFVKSVNSQNCPECFNDFAIPVSQIHYYRTRQAANGHMFVSHSNTTTYGLNSVTKKCINNWNTLSHKLKLNFCEMSFNCIKKTIIRHFLNAYHI